MSRANRKMMRKRVRIKDKWLRHKKKTRKEWKIR